MLAQVVKRCTAFAAWLLLLTIPACPYFTDSYTKTGADSLPTLVIGLLGQASSDLQFTNITDAAIDSGKRIYVSDWHAGRIVVLDSTGQLHRVIGRPGEGPGEFRNIRSIQVLRDDTLLVYDEGLNRITWFEPDSLEVSGTLNLGQVYDGPAPVDVRRMPSEPTLAALTRHPVVATESGPEVPRAEVVLALDPNTLTVDTIASFSALAMLHTRRGSHTFVTPNPFSARGMIGVAPGSRIVWVWTGEALLHVELQDKRSIAFAIEEIGRVPVEKEDIEKAVESLTDWVRPIYRGLIEENAPRYWPPLSGMVVSNSGEVWLGLRSGHALREWRIVSTSGEVIGRVDVPDSVSLLAVRDHVIVGRAANEMDVPTIVIYAWRASAKDL